MVPKGILGKLNREKSNFRIIDQKGTFSENWRSNKVGVGITCTVFPSKPP